MKFLHFQDLHLGGKNSVNYIGNYLEDNVAMQKEILALSQELDCDFITSGGDTFDSPIISLPICDDYMDRVEANGKPLYDIFGNHTEVGQSPELSKATTTPHMFRRSKIIRQLDVIEDKNTYIKGYPYYYSIEKDLKEKGLYCGSKKKFKIAIIHAFFTPKPFLPEVLHLPIQELQTDYDLILCAHNHIPFDRTIDETRFINVGCIGRMDIDEADIEPSVLFIDTDTQEIRTIKLKSAKPKEQIFDLSKVAETKKFETTIDDFIKSLKTTKFTALDLEGMIEQVGKQNNIEEEIIKDLTQRIGAINA